MITIRKAIIDDDKDFAELVLISAPYFQILFGDKIKIVLQDLFRCQTNLFSYKHVYFAMLDGKKAGMILGYDWQAKKQENLRTGFLLFKKIGVRILGKLFSLLKFNASVGKVCNREYYISNIATHQRYRGRGLGKGLILKAEQEAKMVGAERIVLDVEKENVSAINFYKKLGHRMTKEFSISLRRDKILRFYRMTKEIK